MVGEKRLVVVEERRLVVVGNELEEMVSARVVEGTVPAVVGSVLVVVEKKPMVEEIGQGLVVEEIGRGLVVVERKPVVEEIGQGVV